MEVKAFQQAWPAVYLCLKKCSIELDNGKHLPVGVALGIVDMKGCRPMTREDLVVACCGDYKDEMCSRGLK